MNFIKNFVRIAIPSLIIGLSVGYVLAGGTEAPAGGPSQRSTNNADAPINVGNIGQVKQGPLTIANNLWVNGANLFVDGQVGLGEGFTNGSLTLDSTARLDIDGQIRIRGGWVGAAAAGKVLTTNADGLASWGDPPGPGITSLTPGTGITIYQPPGTPVNPLTGGSGQIAVNTGVIQKRVTGTCSTGIISINSDGIPACATNNTITLVEGSGINLTPDVIGGGSSGGITGTVGIDPTAVQKRVTGTCPDPQAIAIINEDGSVVCRSFITTVQAPSPSGIAVTSSSGVASLSVNVGGGLAVDGSNNLKLINCGVDQTLKYNGGWTCVTLPSC